MSNILLLGMPGGLEFVILVLFVLFPALLWIWALIDIIKGRFSDSSLKLVWILIIIFIPFIGAVIYYFIGRKQKLPNLQ